jgi:hypothetical protein
MKIRTTCAHSEERCCPGCLPALRETIDGCNAAIATYGGVPGQLVITEDGFVDDGVREIDWSALKAVDRFWLR